MNLVGYLITLANLQSPNHSGGPLKDLSVKVADIQTIIRDFRSQPEFELENFKQTGYYREGNIGKYLSKNIRDYIFDGIGHPTDEGVVLTLIFKDANGATPTIISDPDKKLSYFLHRGKVDGYVNEGVDAYVNYLNHERNKRSLLDKPQIVA